jgi:hypothetical protein
MKLFTEGRLYFAVAVFALMGSVACSSDPKKIFQSAPPSVVYVLVDVSSTTDSDRIRRQMRTDFETVVAGWSDVGGTLRGDTIGSDALNQSTVPMRASIPALNLITSDEEYHKKKVVAPATADLKRQFDAVMAARPESATEILSALTVAAKTFNGEDFRESKHKALVLLSDMIEESRLYNFRRDALTDKRIDEIISTERAAGRLPSLKGVRVWKAGSTTQVIDDVKSRQVERFWEQYFSAAGAELKTERYGASLLDFNLNW